ncbi:MAG: hypothetical protein ACW99A_05940 [Candidatus Kariarchaeaceae archaeon]|jgi:hypothetical protein
MEESKIIQIAENIDKLIQDFIPELDGIDIPDQIKMKIVNDTYHHIKNSNKSKNKLFLTIPQPFLADYVCKHKEEIKELIDK